LSAVSHTSQIYVGKLGNAYFKNGEVAGETDFFYGFGTAWVEQTSIALRNCGGGITAWVSIPIHTHQGNESDYTIERNEYYIPE
jgi:pectin methylesterase-like acyl-CoA thioesterase